MRLVLRLPADDEAFQDLRAALEWGAGLELNDMHRAELEAELNAPRRWWRF